PTPEPQLTPGGTYTVRPGDTLEGIGLRFGVPWPLIAEANNLEPPYVIFPDQVLTIPVLGEPAEPGEEGSFYIVQPGDTLELIAYSLDVPTALLAEVNEIENWNQIYVGQRLIVPGRQPAEGSPSPSP
ncbi:MAG TPA: LysM peptidoglycan-binding domain-containing protein, partial [Candidatus Limnocylindrales bacterium]|nr:LysM peptidoglycan-binding domain-containing protein [Candidatus Limnocylindrales bacterium]